MVNKELSDTYKLLKDKHELLREETKLGRYIKIIGIIIFILFIFSSFFIAPLSGMMSYIALGVLV